MRSIPESVSFSQAIHGGNAQCGNDVPRTRQGKAPLSAAALVTLLTLLLLFPANPAWALQTHGDPEGLYVHQMAHLLFILALAYLWWHTRMTPAVASSGWRLLQIFCLLTIAWNILAIVGHEVYQRLSPSDFLLRDTWGEQLALPLNMQRALYLATTMDHLLLVPALATLALTLRTFYREALRENER